mgnify:CR=1 FL=1
MLLRRAITAVILAIFFVAVATQVSPVIFAHIMTGTMMLVSWEWSTLAGLRSTWQKVSFVGGILGAIVLLYFFLGIPANYEDVIAERVAVILCLGSFFWFLSFFLLLGYPENRDSWHDPLKISLGGLIVIVSAWCGLVQLKYMVEGGELVLMIAVLVAATDVGGYFFGRSFGKAKLAVELSPNKTWAGVWGALGLTIIVSFPVIWVFNETILRMNYLQNSSLFILILVVVFFSIVGDLLESMLKRNQNIKDSGTMLPGHGGLLDRVDGLIAVIPIFTLVVMKIF